MFETFKVSLKFGLIAKNWTDSTNLDPGDEGQVARKAMEYIQNLGMEANDAWVIAMTNWMVGMPWPDSRQMLASAMLKFLDAKEGKIALSAVTILSARQSAEDILREGRA
jgi:hypothetical protein